jgi:hypothetical protein
MSELAFDREGTPFRFSRRTRKLRPRRWKNAGQRGTCAAVLDPDGEPLLIDADAEYAEFRSAVGNVPGFYRLDQCDEDGTPIEEVPPAYVTIESARNVAPNGDADPRDAIIRDLAQINADVTRTIAERFGNVMQACADILRAADSAGLPRREPPPAPTPAPDKDDEDEDDDDDDDEPPPPPFGAFQPFVEMAMPHLPDFGAFLWAKFREFMKQKAGTAPAAPATPSPATPVAPPAAPSPATPAAPPPPPPTATPTTPDPAAAPTSGPAVPRPAGPTTFPQATAAVTSSPGVAAPAPADPATIPQATAATPSSPAPPAAATGGTSMLHGAAPSSTAIDAATTAGLAQPDGPRNASPNLAPTPEQMVHLFAIEERLSPRELAIVKTVILRMSAEMRARWLAELSVLTVDQAVDFVRYMIPKVTPKTPPARSGSPAGGDNGQSEEG